MDIGELWFIIGFNGVGKIIFLDVIIGKVKLIIGKVLFKGKNLIKILEYKIVCMGIGCKF